MTTASSSDRDPERSTYPEIAVGLWRRVVPWPEPSRPSSIVAEMLEQAKAPTIEERIPWVFPPAGGDEA